MARKADVAILDDIECELGITAKKRKIAGKRTVKGRSEKDCGLGTVVDPTGAPPKTQSPTGGPSTPMDSATATGTASTEATSQPTVDLLQLQSTVSVLVEQMSWFMDKLRQPEEQIDTNTTTDLPLAIGDEADEAQPLADGTSDAAPSVEQAADPLSVQEKFYGAADTTGPDIDPQLTRIVEDFVKVCLTDDKLTEKLTAGLVPKNCGCLTATRVNGEIWEKLTTNVDIKAQRSLGMASVDLSNAYFSIPIAKAHRKYLRFEWRGELYEFKVLPNGMSTGPRMFTKVLKPVYTHLRQMGHVAT